MARVHPIWGRPFEQYIDSFNVEATKPRITWRHDFELEAARLEAADVTQKLYELAGEWEKVDTRKLDGYITLPMLKSLDKLSYSPITLVDFGHTAHISGCIKLLWAASKSVKQPGRSTFSETLREMLSDPSANLAATLSRRVSELIEEEVQASTHERYFDRILGWAKFKDHAAQEPFALRSDMWMLLNLLYDDRKRFLSVCTSTYSLGLSGLMFLLWRYHRFDCLVNSTDTHASKEFIPLFGDVLWRYFLIAPTSQFTPLTIIYEQMGALAKIGRATFIDLEDSKAIINTYIMRLAPSDPRFYEPLSVTAMPVFLFQTIQFLKPGCEHLLPLFFRNSIQRLWSALLDDEVEVSILLESIKDEFQFLEDYLEFLGKCSKPGQVALYQIVDEMIENDFVEFALRVSLMLDIENYDTSNERAGLQQEDNIKDQVALGTHVEYARVRSIAVLDVKQRIGGARTHKIRTTDYVLVI
ncbi:hypothetical protein FRC11_007456 [Ceratobasidium sp. 423]|nr:hypothetical protein FRC11_007456 [Ceratobasidium sp. 423]